MRPRVLFIRVLFLACVAAAAQAQQVLIYDDNSNDHVAQEACAALGYSCTTGNSSNFVTLLTGQQWNLVVMDLPSTEPTGDWQTPLAAHIAAGGSAIQTGWDASDFTTLAASFEVTLGATHNPLTLYRWNGSTLFITPRPVPNPLAWIDDSWGDNGFYLTATGSAVEAAGFVASPTPGQAAIVIGNGGRTIFNGFLFDDYYPGDANSDGIADAVELVENEMASALGAGIQPIPTLDAAGLAVLALLLAGIGIALLITRRVVG
ncbi:MAG TPA: hypothetical protein VMT19_00715 [Thermoanaerobaculaceae bacterium]|nr:hypothetical protein [Thermoanaerobaculaceae bacterium]